MTFKEYYKGPEIIVEGAIIDFFKDKKNKPIVKALINQMAIISLYGTSVGSMAYYVNKFLSDNFPHLGSDIVNKIAEYIAKNPQILDWFKS